MMESTKTNLLRTVACFFLVILGSGSIHADESEFPLQPPQVESNSATSKGPIAPRTVVSSLAVVLGGFLLLTLLLPKHKNHGEKNDLVKLLGTVSVTPKVKLHLVRLGDRLLVLHVAGNSVQRLAEISDAEEVGRLLGEPTSVSAALPVDQLLRAVEAGSERGRRLVA